ncbi:hypothetical protein QOT17_007823 [Balamuthia mandrillaris]
MQNGKRPRHRPLGSSESDEENLNLECYPEGEEEEEEEEAKKQTTTIAGGGCAFLSFIHGGSKQAQQALRLMETGTLDVNARDEAGWTLLHYASYQKDHAFVASLLGLGADPNLRDSAGYTPLMWAAQNKDKKTTSLLIAHNANPYTEDFFGCSPIQVVPKDSALHRLMMRSSFTPPTKQSSLSSRSSSLSSPSSPTFSSSLSRSSSSPTLLSLNASSSSASSSSSKTTPPAVPSPSSLKQIRKHTQNLWKLTKGTMTTQIMILFFQFCLCLLVEIFQDDLKRALQWALFLAPFRFIFSFVYNTISNFIHFIVYFLGCYNLAEYLHALLHDSVLPLLSSTFTRMLQASVFLLRPLFIVLKGLIFPLIRFLAGQLAFLLRPIYLLIAPRLQAALQVLFGYLYLLSKPIWNALWNVLQAQLEPKNILRKLAFPFVIVFSKVQSYLLPTNLLYAVERRVASFLGLEPDEDRMSREETNKNTALALIISFSFLCEAFILLFGYIWKLLFIALHFYLLYFPFDPFLQTSPTSSTTSSLLANTTTIMTKEEWWHPVAALLWNYAQDEDLFTWKVDLDHHHFGILGLVFAIGLVMALAFLYAVVWLCFILLQSVWRMLSSCCAIVLRRGGTTNTQGGRATTTSTNRRDGEEEEREGEAEAEERRREKEKADELISSNGLHREARGLFWRRGGKKRNT